MARTPPGNFHDSSADHAWDGDGTWFMCAAFVDNGGGAQVWRYDGEGKGEDPSGWTRVLHVPNPEGFYCHGFGYAFHVGKLKLLTRSENKSTIIGHDIPSCAPIRMP